MLRFHKGSTKKTLIDMQNTSDLFTIGLLEEGLLLWTIVLRVVGSLDVLLVDGILTFLVELGSSMVGVDGHHEVVEDKEDVSKDIVPGVVHR